MTDVDKLMTVQLKNNNWEINIWFDLRSNSVFLCLNFISFDERNEIVQRPFGKRSAVVGCC